MSQKIIEFAATVDSDLVITLTRPVKILGLHIRWNATATVGNRRVVYSYRLPTSDNEIASAIMGQPFTNNDTPSIYGDIGFGSNADESIFFFTLTLPNVDMPAGASILVSDILDVDTSDTIDQIVMTYDDGLTEADPDVPIAA